MLHLATSVMSTPSLCTIGHSSDVIDCVSLVHSHLGWEYCAGQPTNLPDVECGCHLDWWVWWHLDWCHILSFRDIGSQFWLTQSFEWHLPLSSIDSPLTSAITPHSFIPGLRLSFTANPSHHSRPFLLQNWLHGFPGLLSLSVFTF